MIPQLLIPGRPVGTVDWDKKDHGCVQLQLLGLLRAPCRVRMCPINKDKVFVACLAQPQTVAIRLSCQKQVWAQSLLIDTTRAGLY